MEGNNKSNSGVFAITTASQEVSCSWSRMKARSLPFKPRKMWSNSKMITGFWKQFFREWATSANPSSQLMSIAWWRSFMTVPWNSSPGLLRNCNNWHSFFVHRALDNSWRQCCLCLFTLTELENLLDRHPGFPKNSPSYEHLGSYCIFLLYLYIMTYPDGSHPSPNWKSDVHPK